jgi:hypothetical protein
MSATARWISMSLTIAAAIGVTSSGCSSSSDGAAGSCGKVSPCGGSIVGTWKIQDACANSASAPLADMECSGETLQIGSLNASGTVTFNADMTYTVSVNESFSETLNTPTTCLTMGGATVSCSDLSATASAAAMGLDGGMTKASCATAGSNCACTITASNEVDNETGTYTLSGNTFTTTPTGSMSSSMSSSTGYCVQGNTLHVISMMMATGTSTGPSGDIVATKE